MLPAAPFPWVTATQAPRSPAVQPGTVAEARTVSEVSTVPDELAAKAAEVASSPATEVAAMTAATRRAVLGMVERCFMSGRPVVAWDPLFAHPSALKTEMTGLWLEPRENLVRKPGAALG